MGSTPSAGSAHRSSKFLRRRIWMAGLAALTLSACNCGSSTPVPVIASFAATPASVVSGGSSTLAWSVTGATSISIDNGVGTVTGTSVTVTPTATTTYTLTATNAGGPATATATVTVTPAPAPVIVSFTATPSTIARGASSTLAWTVTGATTLSIDNGIGTVTGTSVVVTPATTTIYTLMATNAGGPATSTATITIPATSILLAGASTGTGMLGQFTDLPLTLGGTASTFHAFAGKPWIADRGAAMDGQALVWNGIYNKFYGVLNGGGAWKTGVLVSFDPATDTLVLLKTLSGREYAAKRGLGSDMLAFNKVTGFYRNPLVTLDGKGLLLLSTSGGVNTEGLLVHVNIDSTSASYLADTVVYDFFDYELSQTNYCKSIRVANLDGQTEMVWGKDGTTDVVFMARVGEQYVVGPNNAPNEPGTCAPYNPPPGDLQDRIYGRMFALRPSDTSDLSKPWAFALGYDNGSGGGILDPLLHMGRQIYWDTYQFGGAIPAVRWATEKVDNTDLDLYLGRDFATFKGNVTGCFRLNGLLPLDVGGNSIATCSGLNGSTPPLLDSPPLIFNYTRTGNFILEANLGGWYADKKFFRGATSSLVSRRLFANGGDYSNCLDGGLGCIPPSTIEEMNPAALFAEQVLATGSETTTGQYFFGDPGVGGSVREPIADRYVVWFGTQRLGYSTTLNKYDRITGLTTTLTFDPVEGAYPKGKLLDLGNGTALGFIENTKPTTQQGKYGYGGGPGSARGSGPGFYVLELGTGAIRDWIRYAPAATISLENFSQEQIRLDDGTVWTAVGTSDFDTIPKSYYRVIVKLNVSSGAFTSLYTKEEDWNYAPPDAYTPAGRKSAAIYLPFWQSSVPVTPTANQLVNVTLGCVRAANGAVVAQSDVFGPASAATGNANRIVYGATYSPTNDAMYLATSKVGSADQGTLFEIDKGVADAALCTAKPVVNALVTGLTDVPSTKPLSTRAGALFYGTANGRLMRINVAPKTVTVVADLKPVASASSQVRGYLAETADNVVVAVVFDYDSSGKNTARRLVSVDVGTGAATSRDVTALIDEWEPYPGVMKLN
jgi:hypothetical protein